MCRTDNGAYYYGDAYAGDYSLPRNSSEYNLECCTKEKLLATKKALDAQKIPINYIQLDVRLCSLLVLPLLSSVPLPLPCVRRLQDWWYNGPRKIVMLLDLSRFPSR